MAGDEQPDKFIQRLWDDFQRTSTIKQPGGYLDCAFCGESQDEENDAHADSCEFPDILAEAKRRGLLRP